MRHTDPVTGDAISFPEYATIKAQGIIRRWTVFLIFAVSTTVCWVVGGNTILLWWNLAASAYAIVVESTVGMAQFSQTRRDAAILRNQNKLIEEIHGLVKELREFGKKDLEHSKDDLAVDMDSNQMLYGISEQLNNIEERLGIEQEFGEGQQWG